MKKLVFFIYFLSSNAFAYYLPAPEGAFFSMSASASKEDSLSLLKADFDKNKTVLLSAHLLKSQVSENIDLVSNYHISYHKGTIQTQAIYHLCCEDQTLINLAIIGGLSTDIYVHFGGAIELVFDRAILFFSLNSNNNFRGGLIYYLEKYNFLHLGVVTDFIHNKNHEDHTQDNYKPLFGIILGFRIDLKGQKTINKILNIE